jgi:subtilisin family serine protease
MKPDISAPGEVIVSALSEDCGAGDEKILFGSGYQKMQGTSMASPHVTGTVALMLERNAVLDVPEVLSALTQSARKDQFTGQSNGNRFGHGKLDAYAAVQRVTPRKRNGEVPSSYSVSSYPNPTGGSAVIVYTLPQAGRVTLRVFDALGREVGSPADGWSEAGEYRAVFDASKLPDGVYFYSLQSGAARIGGRLTHVRR